MQDIAEQIRMRILKIPAQNLRGQRTWGDEKGVKLYIFQV